MREINFRAWHLGYKRWVKGTNSFLFSELDVGKNIVLEQYTGLRDVEGDQIYEGDIIELTTENNSVVIATIEFCVGSFWVKSTELDSFMHTTVDDMVQISRIFSEHSECDIDEYLNIVEVVGNIHQNPELLESA